MYTKIPRDFVFETLESINKLVDIEDFEISNLSLEEIILQNYFYKKRIQLKRNVYYSQISFRSTLNYKSGVPLLMLQGKCTNYDISIFMDVYISE